MNEVKTSELSLVVSYNFFNKICSYKIYDVFDITQSINCKENKIKC